MYIVKQRGVLQILLSFRFVEISDVPLELARVKFCTETTYDEHLCILVTV